MSSNSIKLREILKFLVGGGSAVIVDYISYRIFLYIGISVSISKVSSYILGAAVGFIINKLWTFESKEFSKIEIFKYVILYAISALINGLINKIVLILFTIQLLAFLCATGTSTVINFLGQKYFVFAKKGDC